MYEKRELVDEVERTGTIAPAPHEAGAMPVTTSAQPVIRMIFGLDVPPGTAMGDELNALADPFAVLVLRRGDRPMSADETVALLEQRSGSAPPQIAVHTLRSFVVGEGGQIPFTTDSENLPRQLRFVLVLTGNGSAANGPILMFSVDDRPGSPDGLLQILGWDAGKQAYNFYQRRQGVWFYSGDSTHALYAPTRGRGPFDGHVNGSLVMKELRDPWLHWTSMAVSIPPSAFGPSHPVRTHRFVTQAGGAETLETEIIVPGIRRWNRARFERAIDGETVSEVETFARQVVETTTVNLIASRTEYRLIADESEVVVPLEIHINREFWLGRGVLDPLAIRGATRLKGRLFLDAVAAEGVALQDGTFRQEGDTFFVLACPAPAFEDLDVIFGLIARGVISVRFARALLAVDFQNPIQSRWRAGLLRHFPSRGKRGSGPDSVEALTLRSMRDAAAAGSPEAQVLAWMEGDEAAARTALGEELAAYVAAVRERLETAEGVRELVRLVASRRRYFRTLGVSEFALTLPVSREPEYAPPLAMRRDGTLAFHDEAIA